jgi:hypothetical protein
MLYGISGYVLATLEDKLDHFSQILNIKGHFLAKRSLRNRLRHELGHAIVAFHHDFSLVSISSTKLGGFVTTHEKPERNSHFELHQSLAGRILSRLAGKTQDPLKASSDRCDEIALAKKDKQLMFYYLTQARKDTKAILRQYPEALIEEILDDMVHDFKDAPSGFAWTRDNGKIQELEARLKAGKIKLDQAG